MSRCTYTFFFKKKNLLSISKFITRWGLYSTIKLTLYYTMQIFKALDEAVQETSRQGVSDFWDTLWPVNILYRTTDYTLGICISDQALIFLGKNLMYKHCNTYIIELNWIEHITIYTIVRLFNFSIYSAPECSNADGSYRSRNTNLKYLNTINIVPPNWPNNGNGEPKYFLKKCMAKILNWH